MHESESNVIPCRGEYQDIIDKHSHLYYNDDNIPNPLKGIIQANKEPFIIPTHLLHPNREVKTNTQRVDNQETNKDSLDQSYGLRLCLFLTFLFIILYTVAIYVELTQYILFLWIVVCIFTLYGIKSFVDAKGADSSQLALF